MLSQIDMLLHTVVAGRQAAGLSPSESVRFSLCGAWGQLAHAARPVLTRPRRIACVFSWEYVRFGQSWGLLCGALHTVDIPDVKP